MFNKKSAPLSAGRFFCYYFHMGWSTKRQLLIVFILLATFLAALAFFALPYILKAPTCSDKKQNGGESGIDCGGPCVKLCLSQVNDLKVIWQRAFKVTSGAYDVLAYVTNQNYDAGIKKIIYKFSLYDAGNLLVAERVGKTFITPNGKFAIFEGGIRTGERAPKRTFFEFVEIPEWEKVPAKATSFSLGTENIRLEGASTNPRLSVSITNKSIYSLSNVEVTAILYDGQDNALAVSKTTLDTLLKDSTETAVFTWILPFEKPPTRIEIIPRADVFSIRF